MRLLKKVVLVIKPIYKGFERKHLALVAAGLGYYFLMALFPALMLLAAIAVYLPAGNDMQKTTSFMARIMPPQGLELIERAREAIGPHRTGLLSVGVITTLWLTSKAVKGIIAGLDIVYDVHTPRSLWINRVLALGLTIGVGVLLLLALTLTLAGPLLETALSRMVSLQSLWIRAWPYVQWLLASAFIFAAIELLYILAPNVPFSRRVTIPGALAAASGWLVLSWGLGFYFHHFGGVKLNAVYGILATPIALVIWLYWSAAVILIGAEININLQTYRTRVRDSAVKAPTLKDAA